MPYIWSKLVQLRLSTYQQYNKLMGRIILFKVLLLLLLLPAKNWAQSIIGKVVDNDNKPLEYASVAIINPKDSLLISYASTDKFGKFELTKISNGKSIFQVHLIGFNTYQKIIDFKNEPINMGIIPLEDINILEEIVINATIPISIKKDSISYNTKAFKIRIDDTVEDLLKRLPGVQIDASGKITAHGEEVRIVYVDGKEFFSGDPAIATKNLSADAIKRIDIIDEKSEKERVTGVNDSNRKKVINLELKNENSINNFGKFQGGYGSDNRYLTSLNYNRFTPKMHVSILGKHNNVNSSGSDTSEIMAFNIDGEDGVASNSGFLTTGLAGLNLSYELKKDQNINADYFYNYTNSTSGDVFSQRTEFIESQKIYSESESSNKNISNNQQINFTYKNQSNKLGSLNLRGSFGNHKNNGISVHSLNKFDDKNELDLQSIGSTQSERENSSGNVSFQYIKRFSEKSKRNFSISGNFSTSNNKNTDNINQLNKFNIADPIDSFESNQETKRNQDVKNLNSGFNLNYAEPLARHHFLEFRGGLDYNATDNSVNQSKYENDLIQNPLKYDLNYKKTDISAGLFYKYDTEKFTFTAGAKAANHLQNFGLANEEEYNNKKANINSEINIRYNPKRGRFMKLNLNKDLRFPSLTQLSPAVNDFNPLYISKGNPYLTPQNYYSFSGMYINHVLTTGFNFFSQLSYSHTTNSIIKSEFTNELGIRTTTYENSGDKDSFSANINLGKTLKSIGIRYYVELRGDYSNYLSIINYETNETTSKNVTLGFSLENNKKEKIDALVGANFSNNHTVFTSGNNDESDYFQQSYYTKADWNITDNFNLNSQFKYNIHTDSNFKTGQSIPIWNASISYSFLKSKSMNIKLAALDILNKNIVLFMNSSDNYFEEVHREALGTYYMLSLTYSLNNNP